MGASAPPIEKKETVRELNGNIWELAKGQTVCLTSNGFIKNNGENVMGRGIAREAAQLWPLLPGHLGALVKSTGNHVYRLGVYGSPRTNWTLYSFPVKYNWWEKADLELIERSARELVKLIDEIPDFDGTVYVPRPGCGAGHRDWETEVKPILEPILDDRFVVVTW